MTVDRLKAKAQANQLIADEKLPQAWKLLDQLLLEDPSDADTLGLLAQARVVDGDWSGAVEVSSKALAIDPSDPWLHRVHAVGLQGSGRLDEALHSIQWALHLDPNEVNTHTRAARIYAEKRRFPEAWAAINRALEMDPNGPQVHLSAGFVALKAKDWATAREALGRALAIDPSNSEGQENLATIDLHQGKGSRAASSLAKILAADPTSKASRHNLDVVAWHHLENVGWPPVVLLVVWASMARILQGAALAASRVVIVLLVIASVAVLGRAAQQLPSGYRQVVTGLLRRDPWYGSSAALTLAGGLLLLIGPFLPGRIPFIMCVLAGAILGATSKPIANYGCLRWQRRNK